MAAAAPQAIRSIGRREAARLEAVSVTLLLLAVGFALAMFGGLVAGDADFFRAHASAWVSALLATPALSVFVRRFGRAPLGDWWRLFWSAGWVMMAVHLWWGLGALHQWDAASVFQRQGFLVAAPIFLIQAIWPLDVALAWTRRDWARAAGGYRWWQALAGLAVFLTFFVSLVVFRNDLESLVLGLVQAAAVLLAGLLRKLDREGAA
ncbi:hypothetical protein SAMN06265365_11794 [Tistlia consotensis]|uniref:Uncharacterized protein n=1 Tax=Tistlia consotensis USBA 355 TaxID=560819 RepID=A0A1Y6C987_9PROT|nr:hypothetical protein [Tistlia consotensis]SMF51386.1 hypothetical protein SAMN05428998_11825 [Tistlia consotensis USBA 355]SNR84411.1 hypothetical protein SAMN06265365_11794 [Tistlia consotensis]